VARGAIAVTPANYEILWLVCILLANTYWGHDLHKRPRFGEIFPCFTSSILATLEQQVLTMLQNSVEVSRSLYAKYYFELSTFIFTTSKSDYDVNENWVTLTNIRAILLNINVFENSLIDKEYSLTRLNNCSSIRDDSPILDNKSIFVIRSCG